MSLENTRTKNDGIKFQELFQPIVKLQTFQEKKRGLAFNPFTALWPQGLWAKVNKTEVSIQ